MVLTSYNCFTIRELNYTHENVFLSLSCFICSFNVWTNKENKTFITEVENLYCKEAYGLQ